MTITIGERYYQTLDRLIAGIKDSSIGLKKPEPGNTYACYFCERKITGRVRLLMEKDRPEGEEHTIYPIDAICYAACKGMTIAYSAADKRPMAEPTNQKNQ